MSLVLMVSFSAFFQVLKAIKYLFSSAGRTDQLYKSQLILAEYFSAKKDNWLSDYFYYKCLETSLQVRGDGGRKEAEANFNLGIASEKKMDFDQAVSFMEVFYNLSSDKEWEDEHGNILHKKGCESLQRIYTQIAVQVNCILLLEINKSSVLFTIKECLVCRVCMNCFILMFV